MSVAHELSSLFELDEREKQKSKTAIISVDADELDFVRPDDSIDNIVPIREGLEQASGPSNSELLARIVALESKLANESYDSAQKETKMIMLDKALKIILKKSPESKKELLYIKKLFLDL